MVLRGLLGLEKRREGTSFLELEFSSFADLGVGLRRLALAELFLKRKLSFLRRLLLRSLEESEGAETKELFAGKRLLAASLSFSSCSSSFSFTSIL